MGRAQIRFLEAALSRVKAEHFSGALIIAVHHDIYSANARASSEKMLADLDAVSRRIGVWPHAVLSGHGHLYQRFTRTVGAIKIPYVTAGNGGYATFLRMPGLNAIKLPSRPAFDHDNVALVNYDDQHHGYLKITASARLLHIEYNQVSGTASAAPPSDSVTVDLNTRQLVTLPP